MLDNLYREQYFQNQIAIIIDLIITYDEISYLGSLQLL